MYKAAEAHIAKSENPDLKQNLEKNVGWGIGLEHRCNLTGQYPYKTTNCCLQGIRHNFEFKEHSQDNSGLSSCLKLVPTDFRAHREWCSIFTLA